MGKLLLRGLGLLGLWLASNPTAVYATHGTAGELRFTFLGQVGTTGQGRFRVDLVTYTNPCEAEIDDCEAQIYIYQLTGSVYQFLQVVNAPRTNGPVGVCDGVSGRHLGEILRIIRQPNVSGGARSGGICIQLNVYSIEVILPTFGQYQLRYSERNRLLNIRNVNPFAGGGSGSGDIVFYVSADIDYNQVNTNNSVRLANRPYDIACTGQVWTHDPGAFDPQGDSLRFSIVPNQQFDPLLALNDPVRDVTNYFFPDDPLVGGSGVGTQFTIDPATGLVVWDTPQEEGIYSFAILIEEYKSGLKVGEVRRDMVVFVENCTNRPPVIEAPDEVCAFTTEPIQFDVNTRDPDLRDSVYFYTRQDPTIPVAFPLNPGGGATLTPPGNANAIPQLVGQMDNSAVTNDFATESVFSWTPPCDALADSPVLIRFYAHDNLAPRDTAVSDDPLTLATNKVVTLRILGPPPTNVTPTLGAGRQVTVVWDPPASACAIARYDIYRANSAGGATDTCCTTGPGTGFLLEGSSVVPLFLDTLETPFLDEYCYRVVPVYDVAGEGIEGCVSEPGCLSVDLPDSPRLSRVSVAQTGTTNGRMYLTWEAPNNPPDPGNPLFTPPFRYELREANGVTGTAFTDLTGENLTDLVADTSITLTPRNTAADGFNYQVQIFDATNFLISESPASGSVFLTATGGAENIALNWRENAPGSNVSYRLLRTDLGPTTPLSAYTLLTVLPGNRTSYTDTTNLQFGVQYCYYLTLSTQLSGRPDTLQHNSNFACASRQDDDPPCALPVTLACDPGNPLAVTLTISQPPDSCGTDIAFYRLRRSDPGGAGIIDSIPAGPGTTYPIVITLTAAELGGSLSGCFSVIPVDLSGNEGDFAGEACIADECPLFLLPNVFTPNGDGINDRFTPLDYDPRTGADIVARGVVLVECIIYDRSGRIVNRSNTLSNLWDGTLKGAEAPAGVYYYYIAFSLDSAERPLRVERTGSVTLLR